jgi:hypothetical protein
VISRAVTSGPSAEQRDDLFFAQCMQRRERIAALRAWN